MTSIAIGARIRSRITLPFDEEEWAQARPHRRGVSHSLVAWLLLPALAALVGVGLSYASETAQATALTYQIAALRSEKAQLVASEQLSSQELDQAESAGAVTAAAGRLALEPPSTWSPATPPSSASDPLAPVLVALRGG